MKYEVGQQVWLYTPNNKVGLSSKLTYNWHGPFRFLAKKSPVNYLLDANDLRNVTQVVHVNRLKPFVSPNDQPKDAPVDIDFESHVADNDDIESELDPSERIKRSLKIIRAATKLFIWSNGKTSNLPGNQ